MSLVDEHGQPLKTGLIDTVAKEFERQIDANKLSPRVYIVILVDAKIKLRRHPEAVCTTAENAQKVVAALEGQQAVWAKRGVRLWWDHVEIHEYPLDTWPLDEQGAL